MLPLLLLAACSTASAAEPPKTFRKPIDNCPSVGYYFERQDLHNHPCYLCYCNNDGHAVCTLRNKERCENNDSSVATSDARTSVEAELKERSPRKRSRRGLMDLFFDSNKDGMLSSISRANEEDCKPKSSKSIGCPPKDWCTGCLVCDCDDNGEWQCHVMSFCDDKTPRPIARKSKKLKIIETDTEHIDVKKKTPIKSVSKHKNDKRSVKPTKNGKNTKTNKKKPVTKPSTTSTTTKKPKIVVKTLKKFLRKDAIKNGSAPVIVVKKYVSTLTPIDSPELLKYRNDPNKLAQILYQQYEATSSKSHAVKREIKLEKILNTKQKRHFELKYNARGRKPMNTKEHRDWNKKKRAKKAEYENYKKYMQTKRFYFNKNEVFNIDKSRIELTQRNDNNHDTGSHRRNPIGIIMPRKRRNRRNVQGLTGAPSTTIMKNNTVNISLTSDEVETLLNTNKENISDINNYKYIVDNMVTKKYDNETTDSDIIYESTLKYVDIITNDTHTSDIGNVTATNISSRTDLEVKTTTEQFNYDVQSLDLKNYTIDEMFTQVDQLQLNNNQSFGTNTSIDYKSETSTDDKIKLEKAIDMETTTVIIEENQELKNTENKRGNHTKGVIKKVYVTDIDTIITQLHKYTLEKLRKKNQTNKFANIFTIKPNKSMNITRKSSTSDLEKLLQGFTNYKDNNNSRQNKLSAIKYLKRIYSQLLTTKNNKSRLNNIAVMESICDTFGPCKISSNKIEAINSKIAELISETKKALDVIKIIKGILQLLDGESNRTDKYTNEEVEFKSYVKKLNEVLTDTHKTPLTETQMTQMNYIKNNTKIFINSIGKFAFILNDILEIIHSERAKYENVRKRKILIKRYNRQKVHGPLHKIKNLFLKFNGLQNSFMRNMYQAISDLEMQKDQNMELDDQSLNYKRDTKYQTSVKNYMNKINYNLEKLQGLALKMGAREREKRNTIDHDDAVEYLLTLMEYLLKKNNPLKSPQVADGIDLLFDAIRRAPDVRPFKKKVPTPMLTPKFPLTFKVQSKSVSSEAEDDNLKEQSDNFKDNVSFIKNDTIIENSKNDEFFEYSKSTTVMFTSTTPKYVDVEDLVFNGDVIPKVYMATIPPYENMDDSYTEKEKEVTKVNKEKIKINESASDADFETSILSNKINDNTIGKTENIVNNLSTEKTTMMTQFDKLNEEYEKQIKGKAPSLKSFRIKNRKKGKRLRKKPRTDSKSDVSSTTKEIDEERRRKKVVIEETILKKQISTSTEFDPFQIDDEPASRDLSTSDTSNNDVFPNYFN